MVPVDGSWSEEFKNVDDTSTAKISTLGRPRIYYFELLDCDREVTKVFRAGQYPRYTTDIHVTTNGDNEFSYEDIGLLRLYALLFIFSGTLFFMIS